MTPAPCCPLVSSYFVSLLSLMLFRRHHHCPSLPIFRVGQNHIYKHGVYIRYFWQENYQIYGHIRCTIYDRKITYICAYVCVCAGDLLLLRLLLLAWHQALQYESHRRAWGNAAGVCAFFCTCVCACVCMCVCVSTRARGVRGAMLQVCVCVCVRVCVCVYKSQRHAWGNAAGV